MLTLEVRSHLLPFQRQVKEPGRPRECLDHKLVWHAVVADLDEADMATGIGNFMSNTLLFSKRAAVPCAEVDDGN